MAPFLLYDCRDGYIYASMGISAGLKQILSRTKYNP